MRIGFSRSISMSVTSSGAIAANRGLYGTNLAARNACLPVNRATATSNQPTPLNTSAARTHISTSAIAYVDTPTVTFLTVQGMVNVDVLLIHSTA